MNAPTQSEVLQKYWGYDQFRPMQNEIIQSVLDGQDTLALLPTGGGKSICFQVPALMRPGICLVISPLIALMKDQVNNLEKKGIHAVAITSGMSKREIDVALDNCIYGSIRFLYVSPERIRSDVFRARVQQMGLSLIAVDEAHCISQWGYDFRPEYLEIAGLRELAPGVQVIALTATATPEVVTDIQEKLSFQKGSVFQKSFERDNLTYLVYPESDKLGRLQRLINKVGGAGIVYVRNRKRTVDIARDLQRLGISAQAYHAGIGMLLRDERQESWIRNETQVIVATNAFGMGIDKPDVRWVVHFDLPDSPEAYFQEAGRAGRDGQKSWAAILFDAADIERLEENLSTSFPEKVLIKKIYNALGNYLKLAIGSAEGQVFAFDLVDFSQRYQLNPSVVFHSLKFLEREGYLHLSDAVYQPSRIRLLVSKAELYQLEINQPEKSRVLLTLLRSYSGMFDHLTTVREKTIANRLNLDVKELKSQLKLLHEQKFLEYHSASDTPRLTFLTERLSESNLLISKQNYEDRKKVNTEKVKAMISYARSEDCTSQFLLRYFGEAEAKPCGKCNRCRNKKQTTSELTMEQLIDQITAQLKESPSTVKQLVTQFSFLDEGRVLEAIQWLLQEELIAVKGGDLLYWI